MPPRKKSGRAASSDIDDGPSQRATREDVEDEDEAGSHPVKQEKAKKAKRAVAPAAPTVNGEQNVEDDTPEDVIDVRNFGNHPLRAEQVMKLKGMKEDWANIGMAILRQGENSISQCAYTLAGSGTGDAEQKSLALLEGQMYDFVNYKAMLQVQEESLQAIADKPENSDVLAAYEDNGKALWDQWKAKTKRQKYAKDKTFRKFKENVYSAQNPGAAMPPITDFIPKERGDDSDDDDEIEVGGVTQDFKCPITLNIMRTPMTSKLCQHSFSKEAVDDMFKSASVRKSCPAAGCTKKLLRSDFELDEDLARKVKDYERHIARSRQDEDDGEVIE